ncbi:MAG TPA: BON domain-containing protein [Polyangiaceae bacterium]|nr:BON domain-containing protein [Polyangiaceae bacterium]
MSHRHDLRDRWCWEEQREKTPDVEPDIEAPFERDVGDPRWGTGGMRGGESRRAAAAHAAQPHGERESAPPPSYPPEPPHPATRGPYAGRAPRGYRRSDERIREEVCERFTEHGDLDPVDVEVSVRGGEVMLVGTVSTRAQKRLAEDIVDAVFGVVEVHNHLRVQRMAVDPAPLRGDGDDTRDGTVHENGLAGR